MNARREKWAKAKPGAIVQEVIAHTLLLAFAWYGGLGYFGTVLVLAFEVVLICALAIVLYPQRGLARHLGDIVKVTALTGFLLSFVLFTYGVALGDHDLDPVTLLLDSLDVRLLGWCLAFATFHQGVMLLYARTTPQPRRVWARLALNQGAVTFLTLFILVFVAAFLGPFAVAAVRAAWPEFPPPDVLMLLAVLLRLGFALLMAHIPEHELDQMANNPYVD